MQHWKDLININVIGVVSMLDAFLPSMIEAGKGGHVVTVSSAAGLFGLPLHSAYSASKFAVRGISEVLRFDLAPYGIKVSLVCPGGVNTGLVQSVTLVGVERDHPVVNELRARFAKHAVSVDEAAERIVSGVKENHYLIFTSPDIAVGYFVQQKLPWAYELGMKMLNRYVRKELGKTGLGG